MAGQDAVVTYQSRFARVISVPHLAERYSQSKTELVCLALAWDCVEILLVSAGMKNKNGNEQWWLCYNQVRGTPQKKVNITLTSLEILGERFPELLVTLWFQE